MRVSLVTASISRQGGGLRESVRREALALHERGVAVEVHGVHDSDSAKDMANWAPLKITLSESRGPSRFSYAPKLTQHLLGSQVDVVSSHGLWRYTSIATSRWHLRTGKPYIVSPHGMLDEWALNNSRLKKRMSALLFENTHLREASCIRALCMAECEAIRDYGLTNPVAIIPNGVDLPPLETTPNALPWKNAPGFEGAKIALSLGRLHPKKNLVNLIQAWRLLVNSSAPKADEWRLVIAGWDDGDHEKELRHCAHELGLSEYVWFVGPLFAEQKQAAYRSAAAFVIPSLSEGLPMVVLEAWSHGLPVLMTPACNLPAGFATNAALSTKADAEDIAHNLRLLVGMNDRERQAMGEHGRVLAAQKFSWHSVGELTASVLRWVSNQGPKPDCVELS